MRSLFDTPTFNFPPEPELAAPVPPIEAVLFDFANTIFHVLPLPEWLRRVAVDAGRPLDDPDVVAASLADAYQLPEVQAAQAHAAVGGLGDPIQAYCDLLEVRWLLSEQAGHDVGDLAALDALSRRSVPPLSAAKMAIAEASTGQIPALDADD